MKGERICGTCGHREHEVRCAVPVVMEAERLHAKKITPFEQLDGGRHRQCGCTDNDETETGD